MNKLVILFLGLVVIISGCVSQQEVKLGTQCKNIDDQYKKDSCYSDIIKTETVSFVNCLRENKTRQTCDDESDKKQSILICSEIIDQETRDSCYDTLMFKYQDQNICKNVNNQETKDSCFWYNIQLYSDCKYSNKLCNFAPSQLDANYCDNLVDIKSRIICEAILQEDYQKCLKINESYFRDNCLRLFNKHETALEYERNGRKFVIEILLEIKPFLESIKDYVPRNARITSWFDYGHMIRSVMNNEVVVYNPSEGMRQFASALQPWETQYFPPGSMQTLFQVGRWGGTWAERLLIEEKREFNTKEYGELSKDEDIKDVALILTTTNPKEAIKLMKKHDSEYILVTYLEITKSYVLYNISGVPAEYVPAEYVVIEKNPYDEALHYYLNENYYLNKNSTFYRMLHMEQIEGFEIVYPNRYVVVYKIKS